MNTTLKRTVLAIAIAALFGAGQAYAQSENGGGSGNQGSDPVSFQKDLALSTDIMISGSPVVGGVIQVDSAAVSIINNSQTLQGESGSNLGSTNDAKVNGNAANGASGNIGANVVAGDNNAQDNAASMAAADASFTFGLADSEVFVNQTGQGNMTDNVGSTNSSIVAGSAFNGASGNIGLNVASGNNNAQKNSMSASVATTSYAQSSVASNQTSTGNSVVNDYYDNTYMTSVGISLSGSGSGTYSGSGTGSTTSSSTGMAYQANNLYPDIWYLNPSYPTNQQHGHAVTQFGHSDFDYQTQGAIQNPNRTNVGGFAFDTNSNSSGSLGFQEAGNLALNNIALSGTIYYMQIQHLFESNTAQLGNNAFQGATGNIGINVASGTGNLQSNALSMAVTQPSSGGGSTGGGGTGGGG